MTKVKGHIIVQRTKAVVLRVFLLKSDRTVNSYVIINSIFHL